MNDLAIDGYRCICYNILTSKFLGITCCFEDCMNVAEGLEKKLMPMAESVSKNKYLLTMRDSFAMLMPILIIGSMFTLVGNLPIPAWVDFLKATTIQGKSLFSLLAIPSA